MLRNVKMYIKLTLKVLEVVENYKIISKLLNLNMSIRNSLKLRSVSISVDSKISE